MGLLLSVYRRMPKRLPPSLGFSKYSLDFDGVDDYVEKTNPTFLPMEATEPRTYSLWIKISSVPGVYGRLVSFDSSAENGAGLEFAIHNTNNQLSFFDGAWHDAGTPGVIEVGKWYHVALTFDGSTVKIYKNGEMIYSLSSSGRDNINKITIGNRASFYDEGVEGIIDKVLIYSRALTEAEIRYNMLNYHNPVRDGLVLWLPMEEGGGTTVYDKSGYGNDGTINGATWTRVKMWELRASVL